MCVRFFVDEEDREFRSYLETAGTSRLLQVFERNYNRKAVMAGEIRPSDAACVLASSKLGKLTAFPMKWGYSVPDARGKQMLCVNARSETAARKDVFAPGWRDHRCIVPASYYFEWQHYDDERGIRRTGQRYAIKTDQEPVTWLCGIYRMNGGFPEFVILTRPASDSVSEIHDRMPLIMPKLYAFEWIYPDNDPEILMKYAAVNMVMREA